MEPAACVWAMPDPTEADENGVAGIGADLAPGTLLAAYRSGLFPMPLGGLRRPGPMGWWSPDPRGIVPLDGLRVSRSLRRSCARYEVRVDTAFEAVIDACAAPGRPGGWITAEIRDAYVELHRLGWAHSVETWTRSGVGAGPGAAAPESGGGHGPRSSERGSGHAATPARNEKAGHGPTSPGTGSGHQPIPPPGQRAGHGPTSARTGSGHRPIPRPDQRAGHGPTSPGTGDGDGATSFEASIGQQPTGPEHGGDGDDRVSSERPQGRGQLVGGLYGVAIGGLFAGESMFHTATDASKVALVRLVQLLRDDGAEGAGRLLDVQWATEHLATLGALEVPRIAYLERLARALPLPLPRQLLGTYPRT